MFDTISSIKDTTVCGICGGRGHIELECATKSNIDICAKRGGWGCEWGYFKWTLYFKALHDIESPIEMQRKVKKEKQSLTLPYYKRQ